ncbi:MAG: RNA 2',3'-cyclic phosphodiesterase [Candidatus Niyogibacteria bacterium CG10_big_fil_rev_8_21_14_0_10_46_36]|uniref:RNA 2',3'-cyclic phosphodiesterase n=1 Tax=Candidatus Niyogibacteria bacterium CG10_big_fil_rev_8_21_14_0_10_46_36 TaxID=1974726 RepID=A0A2H0TE12_9BACT|nr:MAG: RNA 2',3'-cyclic phosphodiesterase [Candidatus Niyogibacteria bacterium CG10_big_fil_rev_8_21_14_0_10_46_36]
MSKRIFFAFPLDDALEDKIIRWEKDLQKKVNLPVRWIEPRNLHVTLVPPWSIEESQVDFLKGLLLPTISNVISFEIELTRIRFGPTTRMPTLIWAEGPTPPAMQELKEEIERILKHANVDFYPSREPFRLHVTLARFHPEEFSSFPIQQLDEGVKFFGTLSSVVLMQSILGFGGAEYNILHRYLLKEK